MQKGCLMERLESRKVNSGFSLVELVVVIAIMGVIGAGIIGFMVTGLSSYRSVSNDADVANEAQLVMNQLENLIVDCGYGLNYTYTTAADGEGNVTTGFVETDASMPEDTASKSITVYNLSCRYVVTYDGDTQTISYQKDVRNTDDDGNYTTGFTEGNASLMAENVTAFAASIDAGGSAVVVSLSLTITEGEKSYSASQNITLRNSLSINEDDETVIYGDTSSSVSNTYTGVVVKGNGRSYTTETTDNTISLLLISGNTISMQFSASVSGTGFPSQEVSWTLNDASTGAGPASATCANGLLTIPYGETASTLVLSVASKGATVEGVTLDPVTITIYVTTIQSINITAGSAVDTSSFYNGATVSLAEDAGLYATVTTSTGLYTDYLWDTNSFVNCTMTSTGTITITGTEGQTFSVTAYSQYDTSVRTTYTGTIVSTPVISNHTGLTITADSSVILRGGTVQLSAWDNSGTQYDSNEVTWSIDDSWYFQISADGLLSETANIWDYNWSKYITVTATANTSAGTVSVTYSITVPCVYVEYCIGSSTGSYSSYTTVSMSALSDGESIDVYYRVYGVKNPGEVTFTWSDTSFASNVSVNSGASKLTITKKSSDTWSDVTLTATAYVGGTQVEYCQLGVNYPSKSTGASGSYNSISDIPHKATEDWQYMADGATQFQVMQLEWANNGGTYYVLVTVNGSTVSYYYAYSYEAEYTWNVMTADTGAAVHYNVVYNNQNLFIPFVETDGWETLNFSTITYKVEYVDYYSNGNMCYILTIKDDGGEETTYYSWSWNMSTWNTSLW